MIRRRTRSNRRGAASLEFKVVPIGNSRGVRLPKTVLDKYAIRDAVVVEQREEGLLLRSKRDRRLSWEETFKAMARAREDWSDLDRTLNDGLDKEPWSPDLAQPHPVRMRGSQSGNRRGPDSNREQGASRTSAGQTVAGAGRTAAPAHHRDVRRVAFLWFLLSPVRGSSPPCRQRMTSGGHTPEPATAVR